VSYCGNLSPGEAAMCPPMDDPTLWEQAATFVAGIEPTTALLAVSIIAMAYMLVYISTDTPGAAFDKVKEVFN